VLDLDYAGVDLLCRDGAWYVLEVNATAGFKGLFEGDGDQPRAVHRRPRDREGGGRVDLDRVTDLAAELDDSTPE